MPPMYHCQIEHESHEFHRCSTHFASQGLSSDLGTCHRNRNGFQQSALRYPSFKDKQIANSCNGSDFFRGWDQSIRSVNSPHPLYYPAPFYKIRGSKPCAHFVSSSQSQPFAQSSRGSGSFEASSKKYPKNKSCKDYDSWFKTTEQEYEELKVMMKMKNQKINELAVKVEQQKQQICNLKKELLKAESTVKENGRLVREELKFKEKYKKLIVKFKKLYNHFREKKEVWKKKHKKLGTENKKLKEELNRTKDKLKSSDGLLAIQKSWGSAFNTAFVTKRDFDLSEIGVDSKEADCPPRIIPEGEPLENPQGFVLKNLCSLSKEERTVKKVSKSHMGYQSDDQRKPSIHKHLKSPMDQIFKSEHTLFDLNDFTNTEMAEPNDDELSASNNDSLSGEEANFWILPNPPTMTDVEDRIRDREKITQDDKSCETRFSEIFNPGTPNSLSSPAN